MAALTLRYLVFNELTLATEPADRLCVIFNVQRTKDALTFSAYAATNSEYTIADIEVPVLDIETMDLSRVYEEIKVPVKVEHGHSQFLPDRPVGYVTSAIKGSFSDDIDFVLAQARIELVGDGILVADMIERGLYTGVSAGAQHSKRTCEDHDKQRENVIASINVFESYF